MLLPAGSIKQNWNGIGILVHLEKQAGFHLITEILEIAKKKYNLAILELDDFYLIAAIAAIGAKVTKVRKITVSEKIANVF